MNLNKSFEYFNPFEVKERIHIIGCGSTGSTIAELLARLGLSKFTLYDFDTVESKNIANQIFDTSCLDMNKAQATKKIITQINPEAVPDISIHTEGYIQQPLSGYVFLCVDNIETMKKIAENNKYNKNIKIMFNTRTTLEECQLFSVLWDNYNEVENFLNSMNFSHKDALAAAPQTACGEILGVAPSVREICNVAVCNFINYCKNKALKKLIVTNPFEFSITAI